MSTKPGDTASQSSANELSWAIGMYLSPDYSQLVCGRHPAGNGVQGPGLTRDAADQTRRATISFLISPIALAGLRPFGQVFVQFMIVWQR